MAVGDFGVVDCRVPATLRDAEFRGHDLLHDLLPGAGGQGGIAVLQIDLGDLQIHGGLMHRFVLDVSRRKASALSRVRREV